MEENFSLLLSQLDAWLDDQRQEMFRDIAGLVAIPSVGNPGENGTPYGVANTDAIRYMGALADRYGFA